MKFLVLLTPMAGKSQEEFAPHAISETIAVWSAYSAGHLREFYFSPDPVIVTLIYELPDHAAVARELDSLPMVTGGLLDRQIVALGPLPQFAVLFDKSLVGTS